MTTLFRFISRVGGTIDPKLDLRVDQDKIQIGRAEASAVRLMRDGVRFQHALLTPQDKGVVVTALPGAVIERDGKPVAATLLAKSGDQVRLGPYLVTLVAAEPDLAADHVVTLTLDEKEAFDETARAGFYRRQFDVTLPNIRLWSFCLATILFLLCFVIPLLFVPHKSEGVRPAALPVTFPWVVGEMSHGHAPFGSNCAACHDQPFQHVRSEACLSCHETVGQHADPHIAPAVDLRQQRCESCHHEHKGQSLATRNDSASCVDCHGDLAKIAPGTKLRNVHNFAIDHPQFAPALVQDPAHHVTARVSLDDKDAVDHSNLRFTHATHLKLDKFKNAPAGDGGVCTSCHVAEPGGMVFKPVTFQGNCAECHKLQFEPKHPEWQLPHGFPKDVESRIRGLYAQAALAGETFPAPRSDLFAKPGAPLPPPPPVGMDMVSYQTAAAMMSSIARSACGQCHVTSPPPNGAPASAWTVEPVYVPDHFLTKAAFRHDKHATVNCETCHAASARDGGPMNLLPGIATCRNCHSDPGRGAQFVATSCISCHSFHTTSLPIKAVRVDGAADRQAAPGLSTASLSASGQASEVK